MKLDFFLRHYSKGIREIKVYKYEIQALQVGLGHGTCSGQREKPCRGMTQGRNRKHGEFDELTKIQCG